MTRTLFALAFLVSTTAARGERISLSDAIGLARSTQPSLRAADAQVAAAHARVGRAYAGYLPSISLSLQERWDGSNVTPVQILDPRSGLPSVEYPWVNALRSALVAQLDERLFDFGRTGGSVGAARATESQARVDRSVLSLDLALNVFEAYNEVLRGHAQERVAELGVQQVQRQLQRARALFKATLRPEIDVLSAETQMAQAKIRLFQAKNQADTAMASLRQAIGELAPVAIDPVDQVMRPLDVESQGPAQLLDEALGRRGELRSAEWQIASATQQVRAARGDYYPIVSFTASANTAVLDTRFGPNVSAFGLFTVQQPVFTGLSTRRATQEARANVEVAKQNLQVLRLRIAQEVEAARLAVEYARASLEVATLARKQAERQLTLAQARYETKVGNFVELNDARNGLINAMSTEVDARYALSRSRGELLRRLGRDVLDGQ